MLIPITFNADDTNNQKKGKIRGQDLAVALSLANTKDAGIIDVLENPLDQVGVANVSGGYATVTLRAGYVSIYGRLIYVEENTQIQLTLPSSGSVSGNFGIRINLSDIGANECSWFTKTTDPVVENILNNPNTGTYEFRLYNYTATSTSLTLSSKTTEKIENISTYLKGDNFETQDIKDNSNKLATTKFVNNLVNKFAPKYADIKINSTLYTESDEQVTIDAFCFGNLLYNEAKNKYIFQGNLRYVFAPNENKGHTFNDVDSFKIKINAVEGFENISVINGGIFAYSTVTNLSNFIQGKTCLASYEQTNEKTIVYSTQDKGFDYIVGSGFQALINVTGIILELS